MAKQLVVRSAKLDRAIESAISPYKATAEASKSALPIKEDHASRQFGHFDAIYDDENNVIVVVDSSAQIDDSSGIAGYVYIDGNKYSINNATILPAEGFLFFKASKNNGVYAFGFEINKVLPTTSGNNPFYYEVLGEVVFGATGEEDEKGNIPSFPDTVSIIMHRALGDIYISEDTCKGTFDVALNSGTVMLYDSTRPNGDAGVVFIDGGSVAVAKKYVNATSGSLYLQVDKANAQYTFSLVIGTVPATVVSPTVHIETLGFVSGSGGAATLTRTRCPADIHVYADEDACKGTFDLKLDGGSVVVYNSSNPSSITAGYLHTNNSTSTISKTSLAASSGYVYLKIVDDDGVNRASLAISANHPSESGNNPWFVEVLGKVTVSGGTTTVTRTRSPGDIHAYRQEEVEPIKGTFDLTLDGGTVLVYDSTNPSGKAGVLHINNESVDIQKASFSPTNGYVFVKIVFNALNDTYDASVNLTESEPEEIGDNPFFVEILGRVYVNGGTTTVTRTRSPGDIHAYRYNEYQPKGSFDVLYQNNQLVVVNSNNPSGNSAGTVYIDNAYNVAKTTLAVQSGYAYVLVTYSNNEYSVSVAQGASLPSYSAESPNYVEVLAIVSISGGSVTISKQRQLGDIRVLGRWI